jgi:hypothetical protein
MGFALVGVFFVFRQRSARMSTDRGTVRSCDSVAAEYAAETAAMPEWVATEIDAFVTELGDSGGCWRSEAVRARCT